jgi:hypothetical protein
MVSNIYIYLIYVDDIGCVIYKFYITHMCDIKTCRFPRKVYI